MKVNPNVEELLRSAVEASGYVFWGAEYLPQGRYSLLRVYIDSSAGITVDDCGKASRQISAVLDVEDPIQGSYNLEVSSPGLERPLYQLDHYQQYIGSTIKIKLRTPHEGQRNFQGVLRSADGSEIIILIEEREVVLPLASIEKANLLMG